MATEATIIVSMRDRDEDRLVAACRRGERGAQASLFEAHHAAVYRTLLALSGDPSEADDLVQETFLRAYKAIARFCGRSSVRTWLLRIATNAMYENRRRERNRRDQLARWQADHGRPPLQLVSETAPRPARAHEFRDLIVQGLSRLSLRDRTVLALHDIEGYAYLEIAEILDIAPGTVGSRLTRARLRLADAIRDLLGLDPEEELRVEHLHGERRRRTIDGLPGSPRDTRT